MLLEARSGGAGSRTRVYIRSCPKHYVRSLPVSFDRRVRRPASMTYPLLTHALRLAADSGHASIRCGPDRLHLSRGSGVQSTSVYC